MSPQKMIEFCFFTAVKKFCEAFKTGCVISQPVF